MKDELKERCIEALNCWLHQYASDLCDAELVKYYAQLRMDNGGTLGYIATLLQDLRND